MWIGRRCRRVAFARNSGGLGAREHERAADYAIAELRRRVIQDVHTTFVNWQASSALIKKAAQTRNASREGLRLADERYKQGLSSVGEFD
jgi:outer membrane protein TolC